MRALGQVQVDRIQSARAGDQPARRAQHLREFAVAQIVRTPTRLPARIDAQYGAGRKAVRLARDRVKDALFDLGALRRAAALDGVNEIERSEAKLAQFDLLWCDHLTRRSIQSLDDATHARGRDEQSCSEGIQMRLGACARRIARDRSIRELPPGCR